MTEMKKTMTFVGVAVAVAAVTLLARPRAVEYTPDAMIGKILWQFDVQDAKRLKIVKFDEEKAKINEFEVAEVEEGKWTIPSKNGYPADAQDQMVNAATLVSGLKVLKVASVTAAEHEQLGVVDPDSPMLTVGAKGVGIHMIIQDASGEVLANAIIGEPVKDAEQQRYVRKAAQDVTYIIEIDPGKLSTQFEDWIEKDLLKLSALDIQTVALRDYSLKQVLTNRGIAAVKDNGHDMTDIVLSYDSPESKWKADSIRLRPKGKSGYADAPLAEDEELNDAKLNDLKSALQDLTIVDVERKPEGLSRDLQVSEDFVRSEESAMSLVGRGFWPSIGADDKIAILSTDGEVVCTMKTGVEYVLRFGNLKSASSGEEANNKNGDQGENGDSETGGETGGGETGDSETAAPKDSLHRYLFVMARFNEAAIEKPEIEDLPPLPIKEAAKSDKETSDKETTTPEVGPDAAGPDATGSETTSPEGESDAGEAEEETSTTTTTPSENDEETSDGETSDGETSDGETSDGETSDTDAEVDEGKTSDVAANGDVNGEETVGDEDPSALEKAIEERKTIEQENQRKLDTYQDKIKEGKTKVQELNDRFGDWYYVIDDEVYKKIHLNRDAIIRKIEKEAEGEDAAAEPSDAAGFGKPGESVPGLPDVPGTLE